MKTKKKFQFNKYFVISVVSICFGIFIWWLVTDGLGIFRSNALPSPVKVAESLVKKWYETKPDGAGTSDRQPAGRSGRLCDRCRDRHPARHLHGVE